MMKCQFKNPKRHMFLWHILRRVKRFHQTFLWPRLNGKIQCRQLLRVAFCSNFLQIRWTVENPKRTRGDEDDHSASLSAYHHDLEKVSEILKNGSGVFSGTRMPDILDSAWLAIKIPAETSKKETLTESQSVEPLQRCRQFVGHSQFLAGRRDDTTNLQQSRSRKCLQCDGQTATCRSESVNSVS